MLYAVLCYHDESVVTKWTKEEDDACMLRLAQVEEGMKAKGKMGPIARLLPTTAAKTLRKTSGEPLIIDGPFAETKEQFLGFYVADCETIDEAMEFAKELAIANPGLGGYEVRPLMLFKPGQFATPAA